MTTAGLAGLALAIAPGAASAAQGRIAYSRLVDNGIGNESSTDLFTIRPDGRGERRLTEFAFAAVDPSWSPDRRRLVYGGQFKQFNYIAIIRADGSHSREIRHADGGSDPDWSPNGKRIVFAMIRDSDSRTAIFTIRPDGTHRRRLTGFGDFREPAWSPDGKRIAYTRGHSVFTMRPDGRHKRRLLRNASALDWEPDGARIAFERGRNVWVALANGARQRRVTGGERGGEHPAFSPNGRRIAFGGRDGGIWTMTRDGVGARQITEEGFRPAW